MTSISTETLISCLKENNFIPEEIYKSQIEILVDLPNELGEQIDLDEIIIQYLESKNETSEHIFLSEGKEFIKWINSRINNMVRINMDVEFLLKLLRKKIDIPEESKLTHYASNVSWGENEIENILIENPKTL